MPRVRKPNLEEVYVSGPDDVDPSARRIKVVGFLPGPPAEPTGVEARVLTSVHRDRRVMLSFRDLAENYRLEVS